MSGIGGGAFRNGITLGETGLLAAASRATVSENTSLTKGTFCATSVPETEERVGFAGPGEPIDSAETTGFPWLFPQNTKRKIVIEANRQDATLDLPRGKGGSGFGEWIRILLSSPNVFDASAFLFFRAAYFRLISCWIAFRVEVDFGLKLPEIPSRVHANSLAHSQYHYPPHLHWIPSTKTKGAQR